MKINTSTFLPTCPKCGVAIISNCKQKFCYNCGIGLTWDGEQQPPLTQGDKIRAVSNEELARILQSKCCKFCIYQNKLDCFFEDCDKSILKFLNSEVE